MRKIISTIGIAMLALRLAAQPPTLQLDLLDLYGKFTGRTILHGAIPAISPAGIQFSTDTNQNIKLIEAELAKHQIECIRIGDKFIRLLPVGWKDTAVGAQLAKLDLPTNNASANSHLFRSGAISFPNISLYQVLEIYSHLAGRTVSPPADVPQVTLSLKTQNPLTTDEVIYAFKTLFILNGLVIVDDGEKSAKLVLISQLKK